MTEIATQKPMVGTWRLTSPDGRYWEGTGPLAACRAEQVERVPPSVQLARVLAAADEQEIADWMMEKEAARYRWLRMQDWETGLLAVVADPKKAIKLGHDAPSRARLDAAIDAAMAAELAIGAATPKI